MNTTSGKVTLFKGASNVKRISVKNCPRCGEDHVVVVRKFKGAGPMVNGGPADWWGMCPNTDEPILASVRYTGEEK